MSLHKSLQKLLIEDALLGFESDQLTLKGGKGSDQYSVYITGIDQEEVVFINLGEGPHSSLVNNEGGYKKICDYLILLPKQEEITVFFCELKKTYREESGHVQLHASIPFLSYLQSMLATHFDEQRRFKHHFLIIASKLESRFDKQPTRAKAIFDIETDFRGIKIKAIMGETIPFNRMLS